MSPQPPSHLSPPVCFPSHLVTRSTSPWRHLLVLRALHALSGEANVAEKERRAVQVERHMTKHHLLQELQMPGDERRAIRVLAFRYQPFSVEMNSDLR